MKKSKLEREIKNCKAENLGLEEDLAEAKEDIEALRKEIRQWAEAQDSLRTEWLKIIEALGQIVPVIEGETTLTMVKRIQDRMKFTVHFIEQIAGRRGSILLPTSVLAEEFLKKLDL